MKKIEGLLLAIILTVSFAVFPALMQVNAGTLDHPGPWLSSLAVAVVVAVGTGGYTWLRQQGYTISVSKPDAPAPTYSTEPQVRPVAVSGGQLPATPLPDGWTANPAAAAGEQGADNTGASAPSA